MVVAPRQLFPNRCKKCESFNVFESTKKNLSFKDIFFSPSRTYIRKCRDCGYTEEFSKLRDGIVTY